VTVEYEFDCITKCQISMYMEVVNSVILL